MTFYISKEALDIIVTIIVTLFVNRSMFLFWTHPTKFGGIRNMFLFFILNILIIVLYLWFILKT